MSFQLSHFSLSRHIYAHIHTFIEEITSIIIRNYQKNHSIHQKEPYQFELTPQFYSRLYLLRCFFFPQCVQIIIIKKNNKNCI